jgi:hypothetical protein
LTEGFKDWLLYDEIFVLAIGIIQYVIWVHGIFVGISILVNDGDMQL